MNCATLVYQTKRLCWLSWARKERRDATRRHGRWKRATFPVIVKRLLRATHLEELLDGGWKSTGDVDTSFGGWNGTALGLGLLLNDLFDLIVTGAYGNFNRLLAVLSDELDLFRNVRETERSVLEGLRVLRNLELVVGQFGHGRGRGLRGSVATRSAAETLSELGGDVNGTIAKSGNVDGFSRGDRLELIGIDLDRLPSRRQSEVSKACSSMNSLSLIDGGFDRRTRRSTVDLGSGEQVLEGDVRAVERSRSALSVPCA